VKGFTPISAPAQAATVNAANCSSGGYPNKNQGIRYVVPNSTWVGNLDEARKRWNSAGVKGVNLWRFDSASAAGTITVGSFPSGWLGLYEPKSNKNGVVTSYEIIINTRTINASAPKGQEQAWRRSTATHELGHALRLLDNPTTSNASLMKHGRDRSKVGAPQTFDVRTVKGCY
jgi:hypothetical protein